LKLGIPLELRQLKRLYFWHRFFGVCPRVISCIAIEG
jgi:hypothetical protein